jgi:hypothetical protein
LAIQLGERASFAGHETFPFRYQWLHKAVHQVDADPGAFGSEDAVVRFGVGKNMVKSIRHWAVLTRILEELPSPRGSRVPVLKVSEFGRRFLGTDGWDPYLEDPGSAWVLHWNVATSPLDATTWYWVFNHLPQPEFTKTELVSLLLSLAEQRGWRRVAERSVDRDVDCFLGCYVQRKPSRSLAIEDTIECPLTELGLIREYGAKGSYILERSDRPTLSSGVFAYILADYLLRSGNKVSTISVDEISNAPGAPGRVLSMSEESLIPRLERLEETTGGVLVFDETAGMRQVLLRAEVRPLDILESHFAAGVGSRTGGCR